MSGNKHNRPESRAKKIIRRFCHSGAFCQHDISFDFCGGKEIAGVVLHDGKQPAVEKCWHQPALRGYQSKLVTDHCAKTKV